MSLSALSIRNNVRTLRYPSFNAAHGLDGSGDDGNSAGACCPRCHSSLPRNVSLGAHEASCPAFLRSSAVRSLPKDGRPTVRSQDNSALRSNSNSGTGGGPQTPTSPTARDDSMMSDAASTSASQHSPGHSIAFSDHSETSGGRRYHLEVIQHPERTAEIGTTAVLSRLPLSPPLVVKITVEDSDGNLIPAHTEMPFLAAHLGLYNEDGSQPIELVDGHPSTPNGHSQAEHMLYGTLISSLHHLKDTNDQPGVFFIFPDVSVRRKGTYTLLVNLLRLTDSPEGTEVIPVGTGGSALASVKTNPFIVVSQSEYTAPPATQLTNRFHQQGARMYTPFQPR